MITALKNLVYPKYRKSYAQCAEDLLVRYIFNLRGIKNPTYLDIGANDPLRLSNTALFYNTGSTGINIEANPMLINAFKRQRPRDINLNVGISDKKEELDFFLMEDNTLSTFSKSEAEAMVKNGHRILETKKVELVNIGYILEKYCNNIFPDFLSIDVEGLDFAILKSIDYSRSRPKVICVEAAEHSPIGAGARRDDLIDFLCSKGFYEYANTNLNAIMVDKDFWFIS